MHSNGSSKETTALHLTVIDSGHEGWYLLMNDDCYFSRKNDITQLSPSVDDAKSHWAFTIAEDGAATIMTADGAIFSVNELDYEFGFNCDTTIKCYIYKLKDEDSFGHTWSKYITDGASTHTRTCSTCGIQETNDHNYVVIRGTDATCESAGMLVYACECKSTFTEEDDGKPKLGHEWSEWSRGDAINAQHSRECSRCSKSETEVCSIDENQRLGYIVSDGLNGKLIAAQYSCTICNELANKVCEDDVLPVANEEELRTVLAAGRSVIFENDIHVTSTIDIDCNLGNDIKL
jgi:hypothetical protein